MNAWYTVIYSTRDYCTRSFHFSPKCTKIVSGWGSAPDPAGRAYSAPPDPLAVMGWDGDLVTTLLGCKLCAPLLVAGAPLLFWGWLRACSEDFREMYSIKKQRNDIFCDHRCWINEVLIRKQWDRHIQCRETIPNPTGGRTWKLIQ